MNHPPMSRPLCRKVYVGGLGYNGSKREIGDAFCNFGPLKNVWVARNPPGFAFVEFEDPADAQNAIAAMDGTILCGRRIKVAYATRNSSSSSRGQSRNAPTRMANPNRNGFQGYCYSCGRRGHHYRDCFMDPFILECVHNASELYNHEFDSDDDMEMLHALYMDEDDFSLFSLQEYLEAFFNQRHEHDDSSSSANSQESFNQSSRNTAQQQHRNERHQVQHRNDRTQEQHRNERPRGQRRNDRTQEQRRNDGSQDQCRNNQSQEQCNSSSTEACSPTSSKTSTASDEVKCVICLDTAEGEMEYIPCGHGFHAKCCNEWLSISDICPICRTEVGSRMGTAQICPIS